MARKVFQLNGASLTKVSNAEYTHFMRRMVAEIEATGVESLHIPQETFDAYKAGQQKLVDMVAQTTVCDESAQILAERKNLRTMMVHILRIIRSAKEMPLAAWGEAGASLYNATKVYQNAYMLSKSQLEQNVEGMLRDFSKDTLSPHVATLGLSDVVAGLSSTLSRYQILMEKRTRFQMENVVESAKPVRAEMDALFQNMMATVYAYSISQPAAELTDFMAYVEKLVKEVYTEYSQRIAQLKKGTDSSDTSTSEDSTASEDTSTSEDSTVTDTPAVEEEETL